MVLAVQVAGVFEVAWVVVAVFVVVVAVVVAVTVLPVVVFVVPLPSVVPLWVRQLAVILLLRFELLRQNEATL